MNELRRTHRGALFDPARKDGAIFLNGSISRRFDSPQQNRALEELLLSIIQKLVKELKPKRRTRERRMTRGPLPLQQRQGQRRYNNNSNNNNNNALSALPPTNSTLTTTFLMNDFYSRHSMVGVPNLETLKDGHCQHLSDVVNNNNNNDNTQTDALGNSSIEECPFIDVQEASTTDLSCPCYSGLGSSMTDGGCLICAREEENFVDFVQKDFDAVYNDC